MVLLVDRIVEDELVGRLVVVVVVTGATMLAWSTLKIHFPCEFTLLVSVLPVTVGEQDPGRE